jgi:hypothetical protein
MRGSGVRILFAAPLSQAITATYKFLDRILTLPIVPFCARLCGCAVQKRAQAILNDQIKREADGSVRKTLNTYAGWIAIAFAIAGGTFWPIVGWVLASTVVACVAAFTWYGVKALWQGATRWQAERYSRAEIARRRALGY